MPNAYETYAHSWRLSSNVDVGTELINMAPKAQATKSKVSKWEHTKPSEKPLEQASKGKGKLRNDIFTTRTSDEGLVLKTKQNRRNFYSLIERNLQPDFKMGLWT